MHFGSAVHASTHRSSDPVYSSSTARGSSICAPLLDLKQQNLLVLNGDRVKAFLARYIQQSKSLSRYGEHSQ